MNDKNLYFQLNNEGLHHIGGQKPSELILPENAFKGGIQYLGFLNNLDPILNWLPFSINLICPIYINWAEIYIDYNQPLKPKLINIQSFDEESNFEELNTNTIISFSNHNFEISQIRSKELIIGDLIEPNAELIKNNFWPICPISKIEMKFLCKLSGSNNIHVNHTIIEFDDAWNEEYFNTLDCFGNDGELLVFINPKTKILCYFIND